MTKTDRQASILTLGSLCVFWLIWAQLPPLTQPHTTTAEQAVLNLLRLEEQPAPDIKPIPTPLQEESPEPEKAQHHVEPEPIAPTVTIPIVQPPPKVNVPTPKPVVKAKHLAQAAVPDVQPVVTPPVVTEPIPKAVTPPPNALQNQEASKHYRALLVSILSKHKDYPRLSRRLGEEGMVRVRFSVSADGRISELVLVGGSGYERLDAAALAIFEQINMQLPAFLEGMPTSSLQFELPIHYQLSGD